ncbi:MAG: 50S ribosomal protein L3 [Alphaproteobacteria bacterium]|nr:50S ribosomal protein L3 [Alphaproteobacteria bacterium]
MANTSPGLIGRKIGMTQIFGDNGEAVAVTVIEAGPNTVISVKSSDSAAGYDAVQLGFADKKESRTTKPEAGHFAKAGVSPKKYVQEFRLESGKTGDFAPGQSIAAGDLFEAGGFADVTAVSKGRGFAGVMKKYNFRGFIRSHGTHEYFRHGGSIGTRLTPGHVLKGKKMPGHMGAAQVTVQNLRIVKVDAENNLVFLKGGVPGPNGGIIRLRKAQKKG